MNSKPYYPPLKLATLAPLSTIHQQLEDNPDYLTAKDCPYDAATREHLTKLLSPKVVEVEKIVEVEKKVEVLVAAAEGGGKRGAKPKGSGVNLDEVAKEISDLRQELKQLKLDSKALQTADKIQMIKLRAGLVEKLIQMDERTNNLKRSSLFQSTVLSILDDLMNDDMRQDFMKRIEPFASAE